MGKGYYNSDDIMNIFFIDNPHVANALVKRLRDYYVNKLGITKLYPYSCVPQEPLDNDLVDEGFRKQMTMWIKDITVNVSRRNREIRSILSKGKGGT